MAEELRDDPLAGEAGASGEAAGKDGGEEGRELSPEELLQKKEEEVLQLKDKMLRMAAELENTRRRLEREKSEGISYANESIIREFLPSLDNLERAIQHSEKDANFETLISGVRMTLKGFQDALARFGCTGFESQGKPFDPNFHEAIAQHETDEHPDKAVIQELQKGYTLRDRLIRPAMVVVARNPKGEETRDQ